MPPRITARIPRTLVALACLAVIAACSSDSDGPQIESAPTGGSTSPTDSAPDNSGGASPVPTNTPDGADTEPADDSAPVDPAPVDPGPANPGPANPDPIEPGPADPEPTGPEPDETGQDETDSDQPGPDAAGPDAGDAGPLADLYGQAVLASRLEPDGTTLFLLEVNFSADDLAVTEDGSTFVQTTASSTFVPEGGTASDPVPREFGCFDINGGGFICLEFHADNELGAYLLGPVLDGQSRGTYEFCEATEETDDCLDDLLAAPDGTALFSRQPDAAASAPFGPTTLAQPDSALDYLRYDAQASLAPDNSGTARSRTVKEFLNRFSPTATAARSRR